MAVAVGLTEQPVYPPRVLVTVTGLTLGDSLVIYRVVDGAWELLRGSLDDSVTDTSYVVVDAELPFGVPVEYAIVVNGAVAVTSSSASYTLTGGKVAATDAITGLAAEVVIMAWPTSTRNRKSTTFQVGDRNVVVLGPLGEREADVQFYLDTTPANENFLQLLREATQGTIQLRQPGGYADIDGYFTVLSADVERFSQDGSDPRRTWTVRLVETELWAYALPAAAYTLQDIYNYYGGSATLADLAADFATLLDVATADWS